MWKLWYITLVFIATVFVLAGFKIGGKDFADNLLADFAGIAIAILVGFFLVDRLAEHRREQQWAKVRNITLGAIAAHLCDVASNLYIYFPIRDHRSMGAILIGRKIPNYETTRGFENLLEQLRSLPNNISKEKSTSDVAIEFYQAVTWDLDQIQSVLTPRVIQSSTDQALIDALIEFDNVRRKLHNSIIGHKLVITHSVFPNVLSMVEASKHLYQTLCKSWRETRASLHPDDIAKTM